MISRFVSAQSGQSTLVAGTGGDVLLLSMRRVAHFVAYSLGYEFQDVIGQLTGADRVDVDNEPALEMSRRAYKLARYVTRSSTYAKRWAPEPSTVRLQRDYQLFFPTFNHPHELYALATVPDWRRYCARSACFITEIWPHLLPDYLLELLQGFDHIFSGFRHCTDEVTRLTGRPCSYLPLAADVFQLSPLPELPTRGIDVCYIGRRSPVTHAALMRLANERRMFYYYDTVAASGTDKKQRTFQIDDPAEHRRLFASLLQRSRYYFANRSRVNEDEFTRGREEMSSRFYEGAAAGTVMIGEPPRSPHFDEQFDWPDAVIRVPFDSPDIAAILADLDRDPERLARVRRENMRQAALRHDWGTRLRTVYDTLGLKPTAAMVEREQRLQALAADAAVAQV